MGLLAACVDSAETHQSQGADPDPGGDVVVDSSNVGGGFDGDRDLGDQHRAPGYFFDYIIDVSDGIYDEHAIVRAVEVFNSRSNLDENDPDFIDVSNHPTIAALLPSRTETEVVGINAGPNYGDYQRADMDISDRNFNIHFIGPWVAGHDDTKERAMKKVRDDIPGLEWGYRMTCKDEDNYSRLGNGGGHTLRMDVNQSNHEGEFHFWCMNIEGVGRSPIAVGTSSANMNFDHCTGENDAHFHLIRLHQDDVRFTSGNHSYWGISSWHSRVHLHGFYSDLPWNSEHHFYLREEPYGDMMYEYVFCDRAGAQLMQKADRSGSSGNAPLEPLKGNREEAGTNYYVGWRGFTRSGRWAGRASSFFTQFESHQNMDFERCVIVSVETNNCCRSWPPADPYGDIADEPFNFTLGTSSWTHTNPNGTPPQDESAEHPGYLTGAIKMRRCIWYSKRPTKDLLAFRSAPRIDIEDCGFFAGPPTAPAHDTSGSYPPGSSNNIGIGSYGRGEVTAEAIIGSFRWVNNCSPTHIDVLMSAPFNLSAEEIEVPQMKMGTNRAYLGRADQDIVFGAFFGDEFHAGQDPVNFTMP